MQVSTSKDRSIFSLDCLNDTTQRSLCSGISHFILCATEFESTLITSTLHGWYITPSTPTPFPCDPQNWPFAPENKLSKIVQI